MKSGSDGFRFMSGTWESYRLAQGLQKEKVIDRPHHFDSRAHRFRVLELGIGHESRKNRNEYQAIDEQESDYVSVARREFLEKLKKCNKECKESRPFHKGNQQEYRYV
jgi:hypothetical protein